MTTLGTLFETPEDRAVERAYSVLRGEVMPPATSSQTALLRILADKRGVKNAIAVSKLAAILHTSDREIRNDVHDLRMLYGVRIGSSRDREAGGHYLITNKEELMETVRPMLRQAKSELRLVRSMCDPHELAELEGQLRLAEGGEAA